MKITRVSGRFAAVLVGASLAAASVSAAGVQVVSAATSTRLAAAAATPHASAAYSGSRTRFLVPALRPAGPQVSSGFSALLGVYCTSARNCWAVGERSKGNALVNEILHWNGKAWTNHSVPNPGGTASNDVSELLAVRCLTGRNCWAVGEYQKGDGAAVSSQALRWNGKRWSVVATPQTGGRRKGDATELFDVACTSSASCWAVGDDGKFTGDITKPVKLANEALHWNGRKWSRVRTPNPAGTATGRINSLFGVRCVSRSSCNAVGDYADGTDQTSAVMRSEALHWNGRKWSQAHTPNPGGTTAGHFTELSAIGCVPSNCWAVGSYGVHTTATTVSSGQALHWNGTKWSRVGVPLPSATDELIGVMCVSKDYCWAVGNDGFELTVQNQALHWNGKLWSPVPTPDPGGTADGDFNTLISIRCVSRSNCWAVGAAGASGTPLHNEILHWNGSKWSVKPAPFA
jgi:hypothetical protein